MTLCIRISHSLCDVTWWKSLIFPCPDRWVQQSLPHGCVTTPILARCSVPRTWPERAHGLGNQTGISKTLVQTSDILKFCSFKEYSLPNFSVFHACVYVTFAAFFSNIKIQCQEKPWDIALTFQIEWKSLYYSWWEKGPFWTQS